MRNFTPEDLLLYLYKESSPQLTAAIDAGFTAGLDTTGKIQCIKNLYARA